MWQRVRRSLWIVDTLVESVTPPPANVTASDTRALDVMRGSVLGRAARAAIDACRRAWVDSRVNAAAHAMRPSAMAQSPVHFVRAVGVCVVTAAIVVAVSERLRPSGVEPFIWMLPATVALIGAALACLAHVVARRLARSGS
jgi:hypothetical protein